MWDSEGAFVGSKIRGSVIGLLQIQDNLGHEAASRRSGCASLNYEFHSKSIPRSIVAANDDFFLVTYDMVPN